MATPTISTAPQRSRQQLRGISFVNEYRNFCGATPHAARRAGSEACSAENRAPSMDRVDKNRFCLPRQSPEDRDKIVLVLDLDETLVYARQGPLFARPGLEEFFDACAGKCEVVVWTAGLRAYAQAIIRAIDKRGIIQHCIYRHPKWFTGQAGYRKDLAALGRDLEKTIIVENTPDCIRGFQFNGVLVENYEGGERDDNTIPALTELVRALTSSRMSVPQFITSYPMLKRAPVRTDVGDAMEAYTLNVGVWQPGQFERVNYDIVRY